jgi:serine phosphatase RsbU (regulator of sigma subunit)
VSTAVQRRASLIPWKDPLQAIIPEIRAGSLSAVYYGQRRSGDFYDFVSVPPQRVLFGLFDVAGDLEQARKITANLQKKFRSVGTKLFEAEAGDEPNSLLKLWIEMNRTILKCAGGVHACSAFLGCYDDVGGTVWYVNAGHIAGLVRHKQQIRELEATALPFGLFAHSVPPDASMVALNPGDALLLVSKGIVEANYQGEEYGLQRAAGYLNRSQFESAHEICVGLLDRLRQFMHAPPTHNDVTAMALVRSA